MSAPFESRRRATANVIRRTLGEDAVRAVAKRAQFPSASSCISRLLVTEKLREQAEAIVAEGWMWVETTPDIPMAHL